MIETPDEPLPELPVARWTARRKAAVLLAVTTKQLTIEEACRRYDLSEAELAAWFAAFKQFGHAGLKMTRPQTLRGRRRRHHRTRPHQ